MSTQKVGVRIKTEGNYEANFLKHKKSIQFEEISSSRNGAFMSFIGIEYRGSKLLVIGTFTGELIFWDIRSETILKKVYLAREKFVQWIEIFRRSGSHDRLLVENGGKLFLLDLECIDKEYSTDMLEQLRDDLGRDLPPCLNVSQRNTSRGSHIHIAQLSDDLVAYMNQEGVVVYDYEKKQFILLRISNHRSIYFHEEKNYLLLGGSYKFIIYNTKTKELSKDIKFKTRVYGTTCFGDYMLIGRDDGYLEFFKFGKRIDEVYSISSRKVLGSGVVNVLYYSSKILMSGKYDKYISYIDIVRCEPKKLDNGEIVEFDLSETIYEVGKEKKPNEFGNFKCMRWMDEKQKKFLVVVTEGKVVRIWENLLAENIVKDIDEHERIQFLTNFDDEFSSQNFVLFDCIDIRTDNFKIKIPKVVLML